MIVMIIEGKTQTVLITYGMVEFERFILEALGTHSLLKEIIRDTRAGNRKWYTGGDIRRDRADPVAGYYIAGKHVACKPAAGKGGGCGRIVNWDHTSAGIHIIREVPGTL